MTDAQLTHLSVLTALNKMMQGGHFSICTLDDAVKATPLGPDYGYLFWLNTKGKKWPNAPKTAFGV